MAAAFKGGGKPFSDQFKGKNITDYTTTHDQNICIIVLPAHPGGKNIRAQGCPYAFKPVGLHGHTNAGTAQKNAPLECAVGNRPGHLFSEIGIIYRSSAVGTRILNFIAKTGEKVLNLFFNSNAAWSLPMMICLSLSISTRTLIFSYDFDAMKS